jgi:hypothetical protein
VKGSGQKERANGDLQISVQCPAANRDFLHTLDLLVQPMQRKALSDIEKNKVPMPRTCFSQPLCLSDQIQEGEKEGRKTLSLC